MKGILHTHILLVALFSIHYIIKAILLLTDTRRLAVYRKKTVIPESIIATLFVLTGVYMLMQLGTSWLKANGWFHLKLTLVLLSIPVGIIGYKRENKILGVAVTLIYVFVFWLAWTHGQ